MDWGALYAEVITATGWTWNEVGRLTLPRLYALQDHWEKFPPAHRAIAAFLAALAALR